MMPDTMRQELGDRFESYEIEAEASVGAGHIAVGYGYFRESDLGTVIFYATCIDGVVEIEPIVVSEGYSDRPSYELVSARVELDLPEPDRVQLVVEYSWVFYFDVIAMYDEQSLKYEGDGRETLTFVKSDLSRQ